MIGINGSSSPFPRVQSTLQRDVAAGTISATDETALTSALGDLHGQLAGATTASGGANAAGTTPTSMKDRVDAAIDNEVSTGKLTSDQANDLKSAFQQVHAHVHGGHGHHGGAASGILASLAGSSTTTDGQGADIATSGTTTNSIATAATTPMAAIENFIAQFQSAIGSNSPYGAAGANGNSATSLLINAIG